MSNHESLPCKIERLRRALPVSAHPRSGLFLELRSRGACGSGAPRLTVVDIFDMGAAGGGLMCRFVVGDQDSRSFVAPLSQIALDRRHMLAQAVAMHCRARRAGAA